MSSVLPTVPAFWASGAMPTLVDAAAPRRRILIGKPGLDGHDRGAKYVVHLLRDAGYDVVYTGIRKTPEQIVDRALQENAAAVGLSLLSGAHNLLFARVLELLRERGAGHVPVFGGGVIPAEDVDYLRSLGLRAVFTPGTPAAEIVRTVNEFFVEAPAS
jgi:methylmalonyl-CoA mutase C-terminal domain/subunit